MISRICRALACILIVACVAVCGHAQNNSSKEPTATITGKVTFHGDGVRGVIISLRSNEGTSFRKLTNLRGVTDAKGEYRITNVPPGNYIVNPTATAFVIDGPERTLIVNQAEAIEDLDFSMVRGGVITGRVVDADGRPMIEEDVYLASPRDPRLGSPLPAATTDDRGIYRIFALRPGSYVVAAGRDDVFGSPRRPRADRYVRTYYPGSTDPAQASVVQVSDGSEATNVDITLSRALITYTASGRIVNGETGQPLPDVRYGFKRFVGSTQYASIMNGAITNSRGEFKIENLIPGQYAIQLAPDADRDLRTQEVRFEVFDQDVTGLVVKTVKGASVSGVVVLEGTYDKTISEQLRDLRLVVFVATESTRKFGLSGVQTTLRPDGSFRIGGLPTGTATFSLGAARDFRILRVERDGIIQTGGVEVKLGEDITTMRIVIGHGDGSIRGVVEVENGAIPPNAQVFLRVKRLNENPLNASGSYVPAQIDARGQFVLNNLIPGTYELTAGLFVRGARVPVVQTKQDVVVTAGTTTTTTMKLNLHPPPPKP